MQRPSPALPTRALTHAQSLVALDAAGLALLHRRERLGAPKKYGALPVCAVGVQQLEAQQLLYLLPI
jgi:hypothetical protein